MPCLSPVDRQTDLDTANRSNPILWVRQALHSFQWENSAPHLWLSNRSIHPPSGGFWHRSSQVRLLRQHYWLTSMGLLSRPIMLLSQSSQIFSLCAAKGILEILNHVSPRDNRQSRSHVGWCRCHNVRTKASHLVPCIPNLPQSISLENPKFDNCFHHLRWSTIHLFQACPGDRRHAPRSRSRIRLDLDTLLDFEDLPPVVFRVALTAQYHSSPSNIPSESIARFGLMQNARHGIYSEQRT